jgi:hypothetical protein
MGAALINRRDFFLKLRPTAQGRTLDLSCRTLFLRCQDGRRDDEGEAFLSTADEEWRGEPPARLARRTPEEVLGLVEQELGRADVLRLFEPEWLDQIDGAERLEGILERFRRRGGRIEARTRPPEESV